MKRVKRRVASLLFVVSLLVSLAVPSGVASATSAYDDVIESVSNVHLSRDGGTQGSPACGQLDVTTLWANILTNAASWTSRTQIIGGATKNATLADWATTFENGIGWSVVQVHNNNASMPDSGNSIADAVYAVFTPSTSAQVNFSSTPVYWGAQKQAYMTNTDNGYVYSVRIQFDDLGSSGGSDQCTPVISMALRESSATTSFKELLSVAATSTVSSGGYSLRPLFVNATVNYPSGYAGETPSVQPPKAKYVAMGDSFASGEGNPSFEYGTDNNGANECHRSPQAYPRLLQDHLHFEATAFVACAGATTNDVLGVAEADDPKGKWNEPTQLDALSAATETVTINIGGNDIEFAAFGRACILSNCDTDSDEYQNTWDRMTNPSNNNYLPPKLTDVFEAIQGKLTATNTSVKVYVIGYPKIVTYDSWNDPYSVNCLYLTGESATAAENVVEKLNEVIEEAVTGLSDSRFTFVNPLKSGNPFTGHELCRSGGYFNGVNIFQPEAYTFHPNNDGHIAYRELILSEM